MSWSGVPGRAAATRRPLRPAGHREHPLTVKALCRLGLHAWVPSPVGPDDSQHVRHRCRRCGAVVRKKSLLDTALGRSSFWSQGGS